jgi:hypothetical protein
MSEAAPADVAHDARKRKEKPRLSGPFPWTPARERALHLVFADRLTDAEIARAVGISRRTLGYWKTNPTFAAALRRMVDEYAAQLRREAVRRVLERW